MRSYIAMCMVSLYGIIFYHFEAMDVVGFSEEYAFSEFSGF